jgi:ubiquinone/menaquinone biosynthesis C-methylase UbiE
VSDDAQGDDPKAWLAGVFDRAAPTYDRVGDAYHDYFGESLVDQAGIDRGDSVLDVACGRGAALLPAARRAGDSGHVLGVDLSPTMVSLAAQSLADEGLSGETRVMDAEHLQLTDGSVDTALCAFGLFFFPDPEAAMAEIFRVLRPGGTVAVSTWGQEDPRWSWEDEVFGTLNASRRAIVRPFDEVDDIEALLTGAGFTDVTCLIDDHDVLFADEDTWWAWKWSYSLRGILEQQDEETLALLRREATARLQAHREDGGFPCLLTANLVTAHR